MTGPCSVCGAEGARELDGPFGEGKMRICSETCAMRWGAERAWSEPAMNLAHFRQLQAMAEACLKSLARPGGVEYGMALMIMQSTVVAAYNLAKREPPS